MDFEAITKFIDFSQKCLEDKQKELDKKEFENKELKMKNKKQLKTIRRLKRERKNSIDKPVGNDEKRQRNASETIPIPTTFYPLVNQSYSNLYYPSQQYVPPPPPPSITKASSSIKSSTPKSQVSSNSVSKTTPVMPKKTVSKFVQLKSFVTRNDFYIALRNFIEKLGNELDGTAPEKVKKVAKKMIPVQISDDIIFELKHQLNYLISEWNGGPKNDYKNIIEMLKFVLCDKDFVASICNNRWFRLGEELVKLFERFNEISHKFSQFKLEKHEITYFKKNIIQTSDSNHYDFYVKYIDDKHDYKKYKINYDDFWELYDIINEFSIAGMFDFDQTELEEMVEKWKSNKYLRKICKNQDWIDYVKTMKQNPIHENIAQTETLDEDIKTINDLLKIDNSKKYNFNMSKIKELKEPLLKLNNLVGMDDLKKDIIEKIKHILLDLADPNYMYHCIISGPPGVGKSTVAKIYGEILSKLGIIKSRRDFKFYKRSRKDFIGKYLGHTTPKTIKTLQECLGGVLFIDEAYSLGTPEKKTDIFVKEFIDTLTGFIEEHKDELIVILGGYKKDIDTNLLSVNPGLNRRFSTRFNIEGYKGNELFEIMRLKIIDGWTIRKEDINKTKKLIEDNKSKFKYYGGDMESLVRDAKIQHSTRIFGTRDKKKELIFDDFNNGFKKLFKKKENTIPKEYRHFYC